MYCNYQRKKSCYHMNSVVSYLPLTNLVPVQDVLFHVVLPNAQFRRHSTEEILVARVQRCPLRFPLFLQLLLWLTKAKLTQNAIAVFARQNNFSVVCDTQKYCYKSYYKLCQYGTCRSLMESLPGSALERALRAAAWSRRKCLRVTATFVFAAAGRSVIASLLL